MTFPALRAFFTSRKSWLAITSALVTVAAHFRYDLDPRVTTIIVSSIFMSLAALIAWEDAAQKSAGPDFTNSILEVAMPMLEEFLKKGDKTKPTLASVPPTIAPISLELARRERDRAKAGADAAQALFDNLSKEPEPPPTVVV